MNVTFKVVERDNGEKQEICEIDRGPGSVIAYPADMKVGGDDNAATYAELYHTEYEEFKRDRKSDERVVRPVSAENEKREDEPTRLATAAKRDEPTPTATTGRKGPDKVADPSPSVGNVRASPTPTKQTQTAPKGKGVRRK